MFSASLEVSFTVIDAALGFVAQMADAFEDLGSLFTVSAGQKEHGFLFSSPQHGARTNTTLQANAQYSQHTLIEQRNNVTAQHCFAISCIHDS